MTNFPGVEDANIRTNDALKRIVERNESPGIAYLAVTADAVLFKGAAGTADASSGVPVTVDTMFMAYSTTKILTAIAVLGLAEQGALSLDDSLSAYVPDHPYGDGITIRMILAHTAGVPNPMPLDWFWVEGESLDRKAALASVLEHAPKLAFEPGTKYGYSNVGYWLLESAIEAASGRPFSTVIADNVFAPLGIEKGVAFDLSAAGNLATGHMRRWSFRTGLFYLMTPSRYWSKHADGWSRFRRLVPHGLGYGGLYASPASIAAILQDLLCKDGILLSPESKAVFFAPQSTLKGRATGDALGWTIGKLDGVRYFGKQGGGLGFHGNIRIYREIGVATVYFANSTRVSAAPIDALSDVLDVPFIESARSP